MKLVEYVQSMDKYKNTLSGPCGGTDGGTNGGNAEIPSKLIIYKLITLKKNENGYPILPDPIPLEGWKKSTWDHLFTDYLGQQYQLAYRGITKKIQKKQIPYKIISEKQQFFITSSKNGIPTTTKHTRE